MAAFTFTSAQGVTFTVRLVTPTNDKMLVSFFDMTHPKFGETGQKVTEYYAKTLLGEDKWSSGRDLGKTGLCLYGSEPRWNVDAASMRAVLDFIRTNR